MHSHMHVHMHMHMHMHVHMHMHMHVHMHVRRGSRARLRVGHLAQVDDAARQTRRVLAHQPLESAAPRDVPVRGLRRRS